MCDLGGIGEWPVIKLLVAGSRVRANAIFVALVSGLFSATQLDHGERPWITYCAEWSFAYFYRLVVLAWWTLFYASL